MSIEKGDVVTIVSMLGEMIGEFVSEGSDTVTLKAPRVFVPTQGEQSGGFAPGLSMTGEQDMKGEVVFNKSVVLCVVPSHEVIAKRYREAVTGLALSS